MTRSRSPAPSLSRAALLLLALLLSPLAGRAPLVALAGHCGTSNNATWYERPHDTSQTFGCTTSSCLGLRISVHSNGDWSGGIEMTLTYKDCRTKEDLGAIICPRVNLDEQCSLFTPWGTRVTSCSDLKPHDSIFLVPDRHLAILPIRETRTEILHIGLPSESKPIQMLTLSARPRIVQFDNVATEAEARQLRRYLESELPFYVDSSRSGGDGRPGSGSTPTATNVGVGVGVSDVDTVEALGDVGLALRKRLFDLLGVFPFDDALAEPLTLLRINASQGLPLTRDHLSPDGQRGDLDADHDYATSNRFLTVLIVLSKAEAGGDFFVPDLRPIVGPDTYDRLFSEETPLTEAQEKLLDVQARRWDLRGDFLTRGSWARRLLLRCYASGATAAIVPARKRGALVIYNQRADGSPDALAGYAVCPVLRGSLWLARLRVWNAPRHFFAQAAEAKPLAVSATFEARDVYAAKLYWEDQLWEELVPGRPIKVNSFAGHRWHVRLELDDVPIVTWVIGTHSPSQRFVLTARDLPVFNY